MAPNYHRTRTNRNIRSTCPLAYRLCSCSCRTKWRRLPPPSRRAMVATIRGKYTIKLKAAALCFMPLPTWLLAVFQFMIRVRYQLNKFDCSLKGDWFFLCIYFLVRCSLEDSTGKPPQVWKSPLTFTWILLFWLDIYSHLFDQDILVLWCGFS